MVPRGIIFLLVEGEVPETRKTTTMTTIEITLRQPGTTSRERHNGTLDSARARAAEWAAGWNVQTTVTVWVDGDPCGTWRNAGDGVAARID